MRFHNILACFISLYCFLQHQSSCHAFVVLNSPFTKNSYHARNNNNNKVRISRVFSTDNNDPAVTTTTKNKKKKKKLGLLTFDLDDTLYPINVVQNEANEAFVNAMERFGYSGIDPDDIDTTCRKMRLEEMSPEEAAQTTHTGIRQQAIRRELEKAMLERKLQEVAEDWATPVSALADVVVNHARQWTRTAVSPTIVNSILNSWEMERHHAAERNLYPEVVDCLAQLKAEHGEDLIIGAVTDGKANPLFMTFTLSKYFDFVCSWEDDQAKRAKFFVDLGMVGEKAELSWIYEATRYKYAELKNLTDLIKTGMKDATNNSSDGLVYPAEYDDLVWIHVGDDLAYDVGGSSQCGAKTIYCELADRYQQTCRHRFENLEDQPQWATSSRSELENRVRMNEMAESLVDERIKYLTDLPGAIQSILDKCSEED